MFLDFRGDENFSQYAISPPPENGSTVLSENFRLLNLIATNDSLFHEAAAEPTFKARQRMLCLSYNSLGAGLSSSGLALAAKISNFKMTYLLVTAT